MYPFPKQISLPPHPTALETKVTRVGQAEQHCVGRRGQGVGR